MLFQGEEWGASAPFQYFTDHADPQLGQAVSTGRRQEFAAFGWDPADVPDPQAAATFERSRLDWSELGEKDHADLLAWYRALIALRRAVPALTDPRLERTGTDFDPAAGWLTVRRGPVTVACNLGTAEWTCPAGPGTAVAAGSDPGIARTAEGISLPPDTVVILAGPDLAGPA